MSYICMRQNVDYSYVYMTVQRTYVPHVLLHKKRVKLEHLHSVIEGSLCLTAHTSNVARGSAECGRCIAACKL